VKDVDLVHADLVLRGANVIKAPQNYDYGARNGQRQRARCGSCMAIYSG